MISHWIGDILIRTLPARKSLGKSISGLLLYTGILTFFIVVFDVGFPTDWVDHKYFEQYYLIFIRILLLAYIVRNFLNIFNKDKSVRVKVYDLFALLIVFILFMWLISGWQPEWLMPLRPYYKYIITPFFLTIIVIEFARNATAYYSRNLNPAMLFVMAFFIMIMMGTGLLLLPNATYDKISFIDALFTSASAVCITGLVVVDTATVFTGFGHGILMLLMQLGGLGIMTFAGFIGHMFSGSQTFQQQMMMKEFVSGNRVSEVVKTVYKIVFITLLVEVLGGVMIFFSTMDLPFESMGDHIFFSAFHTISAFCNAGFMTIEDGLLNDALRFNYPLHLVIAFLFLFGGIGFPIVLNFYSSIKLFLVNSMYFVFRKRRFHHIPNIISVNSKIMLVATVIITSVSVVLIYVLEYDNALSEHGFWGKWIEAFFAASTPRSAGFNTIDMALISFPTIMLYLLLMWIGASPGGTGGGIRTTTFSIATLNFWSIARGKDKIIIFQREIPQSSVRRAFAIIMLSVIFMGLGTFLIYSFDGHLSLVNVAFDVFSAYNTCGLSLGVTPELSDKSKFVLTMCMFIGRVSGLTLLSAFLYKSHFQNVRYPSEDIIY
jgi:Trk-type K+ transport system membrane component